MLSFFKLNSISDMVNRKSMKDNGQKGQAVLVVLLMVAVILTIGLSVVSRSVTDVHISGQSQESARAFWMAQGKLEEAIKIQSGIGVSSSDGITYSVSKTNIGGVGNTFVFPDRVEEGKAVNFWLAAHMVDGQLANFYQGNTVTVYWGDYNAQTNVALVATLYYKSNDPEGNFYSMRFPFDPDELTTGSNFTHVSKISGGHLIGDSNNFLYGATLNLNTLPYYGSSPARKPYLLSLRPYFNTTVQPIAVELDLNATIPSQGSTFTAVASIDASNIIRKVTETRYWSGFPEIFSYLLYSGGGLAPGQQ